LVVEERLAEARRDREEMVASRVFDEMEREISAFLDSEDSRPHYTDLQSTNPEAWAPFLVGYFSAPRFASAAGAQMAAAEGTTSENRRRIKWAIEQAEPSFTNLAEVPEGAAPGTASQMMFQEVSPKKKDQAQTPVSPAPSKNEMPVQPLQQQKATGNDIIENLNRAPERRRSKAAQSKDAESADPFSDYETTY
jgi:hypothetical protein